MKRILLSLATMFAALCAMAQGQFYVVMKDGSAQSFPVDKVDSVSFDTPSGAVMMGLSDMAKEISELRGEVKKLSNGGGVSGSETGGSFGLDVWSYAQAGNVVRQEDLERILSKDTLVDMGTSVLWANFNVGSSNPFEKGDYYAWGETKLKDVYIKDNSLLYIYDTLTLQKNGFVDSKNNLTPANDASTVHWGSRYRMPTVEDNSELCENSLMIDVKVALRDGNTVNGKLFRSLITGNYLFFLETGYKNTGVLPYDNGFNYWTAHTYAGSTYAFKLLFVNHSKTTGTYADRYYGYNIRPVLKK